MWIAEVHRFQFEEHLQGEDYRLAFPCSRRHVPAALAAIDSARASARQRAWELAGQHAPDHGTDAKHPLVIDLDATLSPHIRRRRTPPDVQTYAVAMCRTPGRDYVPSAPAST